jgi:hypothetical protein
MRRALVPLALLLVAGSAFVIVGCKKKPGDTCKPEEMACLDPKAALICVNGAFAEMKCRGAAGCAASADAVSCDNKFAEVGDGCNKETSELACAGDKKGELRCKDNKLALASSCRGPKGCWWEGATLHCDTDVADLADPCEDDEDLACSTDGKALLKCKKDKYAVELSCKGPNGCKVDGTKVRCDDDVADVGDPCSGEGNYACTPDRKQLLACHAGKFKADQTCKKGCTYSREDKSDKTTFDCK